MLLLAAGCQFGFEQNYNLETEGNRVLAVDTNDLRAEEEKKNYILLRLMKNLIFSGFQDFTTCPGKFRFHHE